MRLFLLILGWSSVVGSLGDGVLAVYAIWINVAENWVLVGISVNDLLRDFVPFIFWVKQVAFYVLPEKVVYWIFDLPALIYFPIRTVMSIFIGWWALSKAATLQEQENASQLS
ncbi:hypothetical protein DXX92_10635 [Thalassotalea euphylliae]|uniref:Uncharacterized protein n=1 Tax=Thalassotalea euphylliae TaxID=1655234 RepID=A0A3E0UFU1_9GAMM|nr:hypothetical protein DXX92_10635 [Thalassotalea euphylliae]